MHHIQKLNRFSFVYRKFYADEINFSLHFLYKNISIDQDFKLDIIRVSNWDAYRIISDAYETIHDVRVVRKTHSPTLLSSLTTSLSHSPHSLPHTLI